MLQYEKNVLECSLALLDLGGWGRLKTYARGDVKMVTRKLAAVVSVRWSNLDCGDF